MSDTYIGRDRDGQKIYVTARIDVPTEDREQQTTDHRTVTRVTRLSLMGTVVRRGGSITRDHGILSCGQIPTDHLRQMTELAPGWTREDAARLADVWDAYHLNDMQAACDHQTVIVREDSPYGPRIDLDGTTAANDCPVGYRYGSAWLVRDVPADVLAWVADRFALLTEQDA